MQPEFTDLPMPGPESLRHPTEAPLRVPCPLCDGTVEVQVQFAILRDQYDRPRRVVDAQAVQEQLQRAVSEHVAEDDHLADYYDDEFQVGDAVTYHLSGLSGESVPTPAMLRTLPKPCQVHEGCRVAEIGCPTDDGGYMILTNTHEGAGPLQWRR